MPRINSVGTIVVTASDGRQVKFPVVAYRVLEGRKLIDGTIAASSEYGVDRDGSRVETTIPPDRN